METVTVMASIFQCPVCYEYLQPPILHCNNGHVICSNCRRKLIRCPVCRTRFGNFRSLLMDQLASTLMLPCKYSTSGCAVSLLHTERREHEDACEFRPYPCPLQEAGCRWQGSLVEVVPHLKKSHELIARLDNKDIILSADINQPGPAAWVYMLSRFGHDFIVLLYKEKAFNGHEQCFLMVQLIGSRKQAEHFDYRLELNGQRKCLAWQTRTKSIREGGFSAITNSDCLVLNACTARHFPDKGTLDVSVSISVV